LAPVLPGISSPDIAKNFLAKNVVSFACTVVLTVGITVTIPPQVDTHAAIGSLDIAKNFLAKNVVSFACTVVLTVGITVTIPPQVDTHAAIGSLDNAELLSAASPSPLRGSGNAVCGEGPIAKCCESCIHLLPRPLTAKISNGQVPEGSSKV
jgi:hypothetical protein